MLSFATMSECEYLQDGRKRRRAVRVQCRRCGKSVLKRLNHTQEHASAFCSRACLNLFQKEQRYHDGRKLCNGCQKARPLGDFYRRSGSGAPRSRCWECVDDARLKRGPVKRRAASSQSTLRFHLKDWYGITLEEFQLLLNSQRGLCAICGEPEAGKYRLSVDHCHETGRIRGLLCRKCNVAIGMLKESVTVLEAAIRYLQS